MHHARLAVSRARLAVIFAEPDCWHVSADLTEEDVNPVKSKMADNLFDEVPVGVGGHGQVK